MHGFLKGKSTRSIFDNFSRVYKIINVIECLTQVVTLILSTFMNFLFFLLSVHLLFIPLQGLTFNFLSLSLQTIFFQAYCLQTVYFNKTSHTSNYIFFTIVCLIYSFIGGCKSVLDVIYLYEAPSTYFWQFGNDVWPHYIRACHYRWASLLLTLPFV